MVFGLSQRFRLGQVCEAGQVKFTAQVEVIGMRVPCILAELVEGLDRPRSVIVSYVAVENAAC